MLLTTFVYVWIIALGDFTHSFLHHLEEKNHKHSLACIDRALIEGASDKQIDSAAGENFKLAECPLSLALHSVTSASIKLDMLFEVIPLSVIQEKPPYIPEIVSIKTQFLTFLFAQGPPA